MPEPWRGLGMQPASACTGSTARHRRPAQPPPRPPRRRRRTLQRALMHLVHQHVADPQQRGVARQAAQQDAGGAEQQAGVASGGRVQAHVVSHLVCGWVWVGGGGGGASQEQAGGAGSGGGGWAGWGRPLWDRWHSKRSSKAVPGVPTQPQAALLPRPSSAPPCTPAAPAPPRRVPPPRALPPRWRRCGGAVCTRCCTCRPAPPPPPPPGCTAVPAVHYGGTGMQQCFRRQPWLGLSLGRAREGGVVRRRL